MLEISSKLTIKAPERLIRENFTDFTPCPSVSIVEFKQVNASLKSKNFLEKL